MASSVFDHPWLGGLFADPEMADTWSPERSLAHMIAFEAAWSRALGACGLAPAKEAEAAASAIEASTIEPADLREGTGQDGLPVPQLVKLLRTHAGNDAVHTGATSQDVIDTALVLTLRANSDLVQSRIERLQAALSTLEARFGDAPLMGRTRMQAATPITVRDRVQTWRLPLEAHASRLVELRPRVEVVQVGGASGDRAALGDHGQRMADGMAQSFDLRSPEKAWHAMREGIVDYASFLSLLSGSLGKMGQDMVLMAQQGIDEIALSGGGGSSAMPHKHNPIQAELLVTLARFNAVQVSGMHQALVHEQERSGAAWALEWMILPQMAQATGRALCVALALCEKVERMGTLKA